MASAGPPRALERVRMLSGVNWEWRSGNPRGHSGRQTGVIAQEVELAFPTLVQRTADDYLTVDYAGLAMKLGEATSELVARLANVERWAPVHLLSDQRSKRSVESVKDALSRSHSGEMRSEDIQALVGALVEAIKELDDRLRAIERLR